MIQKIRHGAEIETATPAEIDRLLREQAGPGHVSFGSDSIEREMRNWPVKGQTRQVATSRAHGNPSLTLAAGVFTDILPNNNGRAGLSLINIGANPTFVYLGSSQDAANGLMLATGYLFAGGSWDGKISDQFWSGLVSAQSPLGTVLVMAVL